MSDDPWMTTRKQQLLEALRDGDTPEQLECFYQRKVAPPYRSQADNAPIERMSFADLPDDPVDNSDFTGEHLVLALSERYVYVLQKYDGDNEFVAIPRIPESVTFIPVPGG